MSEIIWPATPIAMSTAMAESEWKRQLDESSTNFKTWKKDYPQEAEMNWWFYSGRMSIRPRVAKHLWDNRHNNQMNLIPHDQDKRIIEAQTAKTKDKKQVIKMLTPVEQAMEMVKSETNRGNEMCKVRGFTLHVTNSQLINFESVKRMVLDPSEKTITVVNSQKICRDKRKRKLYNREGEKNYQMVYTKRRRLDNYNTEPFGY